MLSVKDLHKYYKSKKGEKFHALKGISVDFPKKGFVSIIGKSGSGKSTFLNVLGGLDRYDSGEIFIRGKSSKSFSAKEWDSYRNTYLGFVFQDFNIIDSYSIGDNIALALQLQGVKRSDAKAKTKEILEKVEASNLYSRKPNELSGGQKQRIAIARALVKDPDIIIADEPTGNLDSETSLVIMKILQKLAKDKLVIMVTHDLDFANDYGERVIELKDGEVIQDYSMEFKSLEEVKSYDSDRKKNEKVIRLPKGTSVKQDTINAINELIRSNPDQNLFITAGFETDVVKMVSSKAPSETTSKDQLVPINLEYDYDKTFRLIRSKLPFKNSLKMALSSIWTKKFKLVFAILLFIVSIGLFGFSRTVTRFDFPMAASLSYQESNTNRVLLSKQIEVTQPWGDTEKVSSLFTKSEVSSLMAGSNLNTGSLYEFSSAVPVSDVLDSDNLVSPTRYLGVLEIGGLSDLNLEVAAGRFPVNSNEVMISDFAADVLITTTYQAYLDTNPLLTLPFSTVEVVGIIDTDYESYEYLNNLNQELLRGELSSVLSFRNNNNILYSRLVVRDGFYEDYTENISATLNYFGLNVFIEERQENNDWPYEYISEAIMPLNASMLESEYVSLFVSESSLDDESIIIDISTYQRLLVTLGEVADESTVDFLQDWNLTLDQKVARLEALGIADLDVSWVLNDTSNDTYSDLVEGNIAGVIDFYQYRENDLAPTYFQAQLDEEDVDYLTKEKYDYYAYDGFEEYVNGIVEENLTNYQTFEEWSLENGTEMWQYFEYIGGLLGEEGVLFFMNNWQFGYILYLQEVLDDARVDYESLDDYYDRVTFNDDFGYYMSLLDLATEEELDFLTEEEFNEAYFKNGNQYSQYILGLINDNDLETRFVFQNVYGMALLSLDKYEEVTPFTSEKVHGVVVELSDDIDQNYALFTNAQSIGTAHQTPSGEILQLFESFTDEADMIFAYVSLGFAAFAALLLFLNISASVLSKKKEIGTLRAMGARGNDVASIFVTESIILGIFSVILAVVGLGIASIQLNLNLSTQLGLNLSIFNLSPIITLEMIGLTLAIVLVASFLPVKGVSSMKPIDAIKNK